MGPIVEAVMLEEKFFSGSPFWSHAIDKRLYVLRSHFMVDAHRACNPGHVDEFVFDSLVDESLPIEVFL